METQRWNPDTSYVWCGGRLGIIVIRILESEELGCNVVIEPSDSEILLCEDHREVNGSCIWWKAKQTRREYDPQCTGNERSVYEAVNQRSRLNPCSARNQT